MTEQEQPTYQEDERGLYREVGDDIVRPITFSEEGIIFDSVAEAEKRELNRVRVELGKFATQNVPYREPQPERTVTPPLSKKPRGYSKDYQWQPK